VAVGHEYYQRPLVADRGEMQYLWDLEGRKYLDFFGGILTVSVGHCNPKGDQQDQCAGQPLAAHLDALSQRTHRGTGRKIAQITPGNLQQSSSPAPERRRMRRDLDCAHGHRSYDVVALRHAYSGSSAIAKALTAHAPYRKSGVISVGISHAVNAYCYRCPLHLTYPSCEVACANDVESLIQTGTSGNIAALLPSRSREWALHYTSQGIFKIVFRS